MTGPAFWPGRRRRLAPFGTTSPQGHEAHQKHASEQFGDDQAAIGEPDGVFLDDAEGDAMSDGVEELLKDEGAKGAFRRSGQEARLHAAAIHDRLIVAGHPPHHTPLLGRIAGRRLPKGSLTIFGWVVRAS